MEIQRIKPTSAVFFGIAAIVLYFLTGLLQLIIVNQIPEYAAAAGAVPVWQVLVLIPIIAGAVSYLIAFLLIHVYNRVAKKYPIAWDVKK